MKFLNKIILILSLFLVIGCGSAKAQMPYTNNLEEAQKYFDKSDGFLVIAEDDNPIITELTNALKDEKYQDLEVKYMDIAQSNHAYKNKEGVINIIKNGKIIANFTFDNNNTTDALVKHALRIYNSNNKYQLDQDSLKAFENIIDLTKATHESNEDAKKIFDFQADDKNKQSCELLNNLGIVKNFNLNNVECNYVDTSSDYDDSISNKDGIIYLPNDEDYAEKDFQNNLFNGSKIKIGDYTINSAQPNELGISNNFSFKDNNNKTIFSADGQNYTFFNDNNKRYAYITAFKNFYQEFYYVIDKLDNKVYKTENFFLENNNNIYFLDENTASMYDIENNKVYPLLEYVEGNVNQPPRQQVFSLASKGQDLVFLGGSYAPKILQVKLGTNKIEKLDIVWAPNLLD